MASGDSCLRRLFTPESAAGIDQLDILRRIWRQKSEAVARGKAVGDKRSRNVPDALMECLKINSSTADNQRRALCVIPACPAERVNVDHVPVTACDTCAPLTS